MNNQLNYSDEEIKQILHSLFLEKKKNIELQQKLDEWDQKALAKKRPSSDKEWTEFQEKLASYEKSLYNEIDNNDQLRKNIQNLQAEIANLKSQLQKQNDQVPASPIKGSLPLEQVAARQRQQIERLAKALEGKDKEIATLKQYEYSFKLSNQQKIEFEALMNQKDLALEALRNEKEFWNKKSGELEQKLNDLQLKVSSSQQNHEQIQNEVELLRLVQENAESQIKDLSKQKADLLKEKERLASALESSKNLIDDADYELNALRSQFDSLKKTIIQLQEEKNHFINQIHQKQTAETAYQNEHEILQKKFSLKEQEFNELQKELELMRNTLMRGLRESKELEARFLELVHEKVGYVTKALQIQKVVDQQKIEITDLKTKLMEEKKNQESLKLNWQAETQQSQIEFKLTLENLAEKDHQLKQLRLELEEQIQLLKEYKIKIDALDNDKASLVAKLEESGLAIAEAENRLKVAQQHLAKKVKDNTLLNEKMEEQASQIQDLNNQLIIANQKFAETSQNYELQLQQEKRLQDQLKETLKFAEGQISKWEEKYFRLYEKWQEVEKKNKELKVLEEKHAQLQNLLANLGNVMGIAPSSEVAEVPAPLSELTQKLAVQPAPKEPVSAVASPDEVNLFEHSAPGSGRMKQSFFDEQ